MRRSTKTVLLKIITAPLTLIAIFLFNSSASAQLVNKWFGAEQIAPKTWLISDNHVDDIYLLEGKDSTLLIDAGLGLADLKDFVQTLTSKPLIIVNTHAHPDHSGGDFQF